MLYRAAAGRDTNRAGRRRHSSNSRCFMRNAERFGTQYSLGMPGGFFPAGAPGDNDEVLAVAQDELAFSKMALLPDMTPG
jgi:hypothetical protein